MTLLNPICFCFPPGHVCWRSAKQKHFLVTSFVCTKVTRLLIREPSHVVEVANQRVFQPGDIRVKHDSDSVYTQSAFSLSGVESWFQCDGELIENRSLQFFSQFSWSVRGRCFGNAAKMLTHSLLLNYNLIFRGVFFLSIPTFFFFFGVVSLPRGMIVPWACQHLAASSCVFLNLHFYIDSCPYGSVYLSPPADTSWRR